MISIAKPVLGEEEKAAVLRVLNSGHLAQGEQVAAFEHAFAHYIGVKHAIATSNGTTALHAALLAEGIDSGAEVITTPFSFIATANSIRMVGAIPVFVDIDEQTFNLDPSKIEQAITPKTKAILPVHLFGLSANMTKIVQIAQKHKLKIIEDACQAHGAIHNGRRVGSFATACFSFYPTKNMTTGEGGMITTDDDLLAATLRLIISHGSKERYFHEMVGYNYRMTDIAASIGLEQLKKLDHFNTIRRQNASFLSKNINKKGIIHPPVVEGHVFHQYTIRVTPQSGSTRDAVRHHLQEKNIGSAVFYPLPIHKQKAYPQSNNQNFPVTEKVAAEVLSLPVHPSLTTEDLQKISEAFETL